jgi:hypothetical protein
MERKMNVMHTRKDTKQEDVRSKVLSMKPNPSSVRRKTLFGRGMDGLVP